MSFVPRDLVSIQVGRYSANVYPKIDAMMPIFERLGGWGQTWIWDDLMVTGGTDWIAQAIADNSLVAVTDGSYIKEHYPELCSAAFVLECTKGRPTGWSICRLKKVGMPPFFICHVEQRSCPPAVAEIAARSDRKDWPLSLIESAPFRPLSEALLLDRRAHQHLWRSLLFASD